MRTQKLPELPEVERVRRSLQAAMAGAAFDRVILNRPDLRKPFPAGFARRLRHQSVRAITRRGKYLIGELSSGDALVMHLGMSGWFRIQTAAPFRTRARRSSASADRDEALENRHDHVIFHMSSGRTVIFNDSRRFGAMDLVPAGQLPQHSSVGQLGPEPLTRAFDARALAAGCAERRIALKVALLDQRIVAGIGNIYASEALHLSRLSPFRLAATLATLAGAPRPGCVRLAAAIKSVLRRAISLKESARYSDSRFRVYDRDGERCPTPGCRGTIALAVQVGRSTFYCPSCQK